MSLRSYKNPDFIYKLSNKELINYYDCLRHHHSFRKYCKCKETSSRPLDDSCPCSCNLGAHYCSFSSKRDTIKCGEKSAICPYCSCQIEVRLDNSLNSTGSSLNSNNESKNNSSLLVCENYAPSYTLKEHQLSDLNKKLHDLRKSKKFLKSTLKDLDNLIENDNKKINDDGLDEIERFYRKSNKFIGSSMKISSLRKHLPRKDIKSSKHIIGHDPMNSKNYPLYGSSIFNLRESGMFADSELAEKLIQVKGIKAIEATVARQDLNRSKSAIIFCQEK
jgi:hypothetical protein